MKKERERYFTDSELALIHTGTSLRRALDDLQYARQLIESADDSLGDVLHYKHEVFEKLDYVTRQVRAIEADVQKMISPEGLS